jgi:hypothetical protein
MARLLRALRPAARAVVPVNIARLIVSLSPLVRPILSVQIIKFARAVQIALMARVILGSRTAAAQNKLLQSRAAMLLRQRKVLAALAVRVRLLTLTVVTVVMVLLLIAAAVVVEAARLEVKVLVRMGRAQPP